MSMCCALLASLARLATHSKQVEAYPRPLMKWTEELYRGAFGQFGDFRLRENGDSAFPQQHANRKSVKYGFSWLYQKVGRKACLPICCRSLPLSHAWFAN